MKHKASLKRVFSRAKNTNASNVVTLSTLAKDINDTKKDLHEIRLMIEIQTDIMEIILKTSNKKDVVPPKIVIN